MKHLTTLRDESIEDILAILDRARELKNGSRGELRGKICANLFFEPSTRTQNSFIMAEKKLGMEDINLNPTVSSLQKGESLYDTVMTFQAIGVDAVIIRAKEDHYYEELLPSLAIPLINGGDGTGDHPTQSLLDLLTIREEFGSFEGLQVVICGDIRHSRVARTNREIMERLGMSVKLAAPVGLREEGSGYGDLDDLLPEADILMLLRVQHERHEKDLSLNQADYLAQYGLNQDRYDRMKAGAIIMHPAPVNRGWEIQSDLVESSRSRIFRQMENGVYVRMAVLERALKERE